MLLVVSRRPDRLAGAAQAARGRATRSPSIGPAAVPDVRRRRAARLRRAPTSAIFIGDNDTLYTILDGFTSVIAVSWSATCSTCVIQRWQDATLPQRRAMAPVLWSGICLLVLLAGSLTSEAVDGPDSVSNVTSLLAIIFFALTPYGVPVRPAALARPAGRRGDRAAAPDGGGERPQRAARDALRRARRPLPPGRLLAGGQAPLGRRRRAADRRCPTRTTRPARSRAWSARAAPSARSSTTAR